MQFTINCPNDGEIVVNLNNIENMVIRDKSQADITFVCPICGTHITMSTPVPAFLMSTMENLSKELGVPLEDGKILFNTVIGDPDSDGDEITFGLEDMQEQAQQFARLGFEMNGRKVRTPIKLKQLDDSDKSHLEYFRHELDGVATVDDLLKELD
ncbi:MAG: hypothetical protein JJE36_00570 [Coriobacteriia bacterium]|nr:hypothetical protein [Coriobacteriia bacterium]